MIVEKSDPFSLTWYCSLGYEPVDLTEEEFNSLPEKKAYAIVGNDAIYLDTCNRRQR